MKVNVKVDQTLKFEDSTQREQLEFEQMYPGPQTGTLPSGLHLTTLAAQ